MTKRGGKVVVVVVREVEGRRRDPVPMAGETEKRWASAVEQRGRSCGGKKHEEPGGATHFQIC